MSQYQKILDEIFNLNVLSFLIKILDNKIFEKQDQVNSIIIGILANLSFNDQLKDKILQYDGIGEILNRLPKNKIDVIRLLTNLSLSDEFEPSILKKE